jgi:hypothetical protein
VAKTKTERDIIRMQKQERKRLQKYETHYMSGPIKNTSSPLTFFIGLILCGLGLFWLFSRVSVQSTLFGGYGSSYLFSIGNFNLPNGTVILPFVIGVLLLFILEKKRFGVAVCILGLLIILLSIIMSTRIMFQRTSMFEYIFMFLFIASGSGMMLKSILSK